jgi:hypothetical protein
MTDLQDRANPSARYLSLDRGQRLILAIAYHNGRLSSQNSRSVVTPNSDRGMDCTLGRRGIPFYRYADGYAERLPALAEKLGSAHQHHPGTRQKAGSTPPPRGSWKLSPRSGGAFRCRSELIISRPASIDPIRELEGR